jgi:ribonuclease BN (tRNA processing enzyme)
VHEAAHGLRKVENARESGHSSAEDAARIAKDAQGIDWAWFTSEKRM